MDRYAEQAQMWSGCVPVGQGLIAALMSIMEPEEAEDFLADYLRRANSPDGSERHAFCSRVRAMAEWLRHEERELQGRTLQ